MPKYSSQVLLPFSLDRKKEGTQNSKNENSMAF